MHHLSKVACAGILVVLFSFAPAAEAAGLSSGQIQAIISLVRSFGGDDTVVQNVSNALHGQAPVAAAPVTSGAPFLESIFPATGPIGTTVDLVGTNLAGFEGDLNAVIVNS